MPNKTIISIIFAINNLLCKLFAINVKCSQNPNKIIHETKIDFFFFIVLQKQTKSKIEVLEQLNSKLLLSITRIPL